METKAAEREKERENRRERKKGPQLRQIMARNWARQIPRGEEKTKPEYICILPRSKKQMNFFALLPNEAIRSRVEGDARIVYPNEDLYPCA